jgi:adenylate cyclase
MGALARIRASASFGSSRRHCRFLTFVVEETLAGRASRIKAYTVATSVFGRADDFDPQQDSIVRIEAGRLRRAMEHYYLTTGAADRVRILIPKGTYVPRFELDEAEAAGRATSEPMSPPPRPHPGGQGLRVFVSPIKNDSVGAEPACLASGLTRQLIMGLTRFVNLRVYGVTASELHGPQAGQHQCSMARDVDFMLTGTVAVNADGLILELLMQENPGGRFVWAEQFRCDPATADMIRLRNDIADQAVQRLVAYLGTPRHAIDRTGCADHYSTKDFPFMSSSCQA